MVRCRTVFGLGTGGNGCSESMAFMPDETHAWNPFAKAEEEAWLKAAEDAAKLGRTPEAIRARMLLLSATLSQAIQDHDFITVREVTLGLENLAKELK